ncbi:hypothetical protein VTN96DRAFT_5947 [Rasamsonia emersonii]|uniref:DUF1711 domain protein n=1 Tax=Rasamsonia emersonii (strain ATCC 16479 / CBS 393.64 / IMI 116815) TaxID=1408163 RepID=A0A0F4YLS3_RASE3|nr:DUF1711 domain protein [Rasamsonia emersonii CBS 393.64]KKA18568.1 DUF1711 domain protein [Rasamsonia emersonii CBS 393.64]
MPASNSSASPSTNGRSGRSIVLKLPSSLLARFPSSSTPSEDKDRPKDMSSPPSSTSGDAVPPASSVDNASDAPSTPAGADGARRKGMPGPKPGNKRGLTQNGDLGPKPRGKPGPKKKPRLDDGTVDTTRLAPTTHKLGPKANQGAINAGLRALDRSGTPCRRWERKPFQLKSFTGVVWELPTWRAPKPQKSDKPNGEAKEGIVENGDSDSKANQTGSAAPSEKSNLGDGDLTPLPASVTDSPAPTITMAA